MNIQQIKKDVEAGIIVSKPTWEKLVKAALMMDAALASVVENSNGQAGSDAQKVLDAVEAL